MAKHSERERKRWRAKEMENESNTLTVLLSNVAIITVIAITEVGHSFSP